MDKTENPRATGRENTVKNTVEDDVSVIARSEWTARQIVMGTLTIIGVASVFLLIYRLYMVIFLLFAAIAVQVALSPVVEWLYRRRVPRGLGVLSVYTGLVLLLGFTLWYGAPVLVEQTSGIVRDMPALYQGGREFLTESPVALVRRLGRLLPEEPSLPFLMELADTNGEAAETTSTSGPGVLWIALRTIFAVLSIFVLAYYWTLEGNTILRRLVLKAPSAQREELRALIEEFQGKIGGYFRGTAVLCLLVGVASTLAFLALGIPNAIMLGVIMGVTEAIPVLGPILGAIPAVGLTLAVAPEKTLWVIGAVILIQGLEGNILVPKVMDESVGVNAVVSLLAITAFGALFGIAGAILAIPLAAIVQILLGRILFNTPIRQDMATSHAASESVSRSQIGVLRLETQEIITDLHKSPEVEDVEMEEKVVAQTEDKLEAVAMELDTILARLEAADTQSTRRPWRLLSRRRGQAST